LTVIKEKISIIHEKTSITAGEMSIIRHPLRPGRPRTRKRRHPAVPGLNVSIDQSFLALICGAIAPVFSPLGFGTWQAAAALVTGFLAKEVVVSTMNILYFVPDGSSLVHAVTEVFTPLSAYSFMVFTLLYIPCLATAATIQKETGSKKWTLFAIVYALIIAYILSFVIFRLGLLLGLN